MSETGEKMRQMVEDEAAKAEAENPDDDADEAEAEADETDAPPEGEPTPQPAPPPLQLVPDGAEALEKATRTYYRAVEKAFGGKLPPECPACNGLGFDLTGGAGAPDFPEVDEYRACSMCAGLGKVRTGSHVEGHDLRDCPTCQGRGYLEKLLTAAASPETPEYGTPAWMGSVPPPPAATNVQAPAPMQPVGG